MNIFKRNQINISNRRNAVTLLRLPSTEVRCPTCRLSYCHYQHQVVRLSGCPDLDLIWPTLYPVVSVVADILVSLSMLFNWDHKCIFKLQSFQHNGRSRKVAFHRARLKQWTLHVFKQSFVCSNTGQVSQQPPNQRQDNGTLLNLQILEIFFLRQTQDKTTEHFQIFKYWKYSFCQRCPQLGRDVRNTGENRWRQIFARCWYKCWKNKGD